jgi:transposase-like protein
MNLEQKEILRKKRVLEYAEACGNVLKTCRHFGVSRSNFYIWRTAYRLQGDAGLVRKKPVARSHPNQTPAEVVEKVLYLRQKTISVPSASSGTCSAITTSGSQMLASTASCGATV